MPTGPATRLQGIAVNSTALQLSWQPPSFDQLNGILRLYTVSLHESLTGQTMIYNTSASLFTVGSLIPCTMYSWNVMPYTIGYGPVSSGSYSVNTLPEINGMFTTPDYGVSNRQCIAYSRHHLHVMLGLLSILLPIVVL